MAATPAGVVRRPPFRLGWQRFEQRLSPRVQQWVRLLHGASRVAAVLVMLFGALGLLGALAHVRVLERIGPGWAAMDASTALALLLAGAALFGLADERVSPAVRHLSQALAVLVGVVGALHLMVYAYRWSALAAWLDPGYLAPDHPSEASTGLSLLLASAGLLLANTETHARHRRPTEYLAAALLAIAVPVIMAYAFGLTRPPWRQTEMALHTGVALLVLAVGILWMRPERGWMAVVTSDTVGGVTARRLGLLALVTPLVLGGLVMGAARAGYFDAVWAPSLVSSLVLFVYVGLVVSTATVLHRQDVARHTTEQRLMAQEAAVRALAETETLEAATQRVLSAVAGHLGWDVGLYWRVDREQGVLRLTHVWQAGDVNLTHFEGQARSLVFRPGVGLPGRVWMTGRPAWNPDMQVFPSFRAWGAMESGLHASFGFPVRVGAEVVGVLEFLSRTPREPDQALMDTLPVLGSQLGESMERKGAEERLRDSEERLRLLLQGVKDHAIFMLDAEGRVSSWNEEAERITGFARADILGRPLAALYTPEDAAAGLPAQALETARGGRTEQEGWRVRRDGSRFWANVVIAAVRDPAGQVLGFTSITRNMTERKRAEDELRAARDTAEAAHRELESFSYSVSHDLRAPLRSIQGFARELLEQHAGGLDPTGHEYLERIAAASGRMSQLIDDLLKLSRTARGALEVQDVDLSALAREVAGEHEAANPGRAVELVIADGVHARGDPRLLRVVLDNLLGNAWKFTARRERARVEFGVGSQRGQPVYFVRDNGVGFDMQQVDRLFRPFERLHPESEFGGTGIGLATAQRIVSRHGGRLWAEGQPDKGALFFFTLGQQAAA